MFTLPPTWGAVLAGETPIAFTASPVQSARYFPPRAIRPYWPGGRLYLGKEGFSWCPGWPMQSELRATARSQERWRREWKTLRAPKWRMN
nr:MAG TPA: hypothetical protein [Caudoviricetes sp.]